MMLIVPSQATSVLKLSLSNGSPTDHEIKPTDSVSAITSSPSAKTWS